MKTPEETYLDKLSAREEAIQEALSSGTAKSFDEYRYLVGKIDGIREAARELEDFMAAARRQG